MSCVDINQETREVSAAVVEASSFGGWLRDLSLPAGSDVARLVADRVMFGAGVGRNHPELCGMAVLVLAHLRAGGIVRRSGVGPWRLTEGGRCVLSRDLAARSFRGVTS